MKIFNKTSTAVAVLLFFIAATFVLLFPVFFRQASFCIHFDNRIQAFPFFSKLASCLHKGYLPVWDANTYGGKNFAGEFQTGIFYPLNLLWAWIFGTKDGIDVYYVDLLVALHYLICVMGTWFLCRALKFSMPASIATALIFTFTGTVAARSGGQTCIFFGLALLPWAVYFLVRYYWGDHKKKYLVYSGLIGGLQILAGHIQPFFHTILINAVIIIYFEFNNYKNLKAFAGSVFLNSFIVVFVALLITLPQLYYAAQYMTNCYRWIGADQPIASGQKVPFSVYAYKYILTPYNVLNLFGKDYGVPEDDNYLYMGILPLVLLVVFFIARKHLKNSMEQAHLLKILKIVAATGLIISLGYLTFACVIVYEIPLANTVRELARYVILVNFGVALLVGLAINKISEIRQFLQSTQSKWLYPAIILLINAVYIILFPKNSVPLRVSLPYLLSIIFIILLVRVKSVSLLQFLGIGFILCDLFLNPVNASDTNTELYPPRYFAKNKIITFLEGTYGKYRTHFEFQNDDMARKNIGDVYNIQTRLGHGATMNKPYFDFISQGWELNSEVNDLLNVRYVVTNENLDSIFTLKDSTSQYKLYERKNYYPRAYWKKQLGKPGGIIEEENRQTIKQLDYNDIYQKIDVDCVTPDTLILSENNFPGWKCYDNGKAIKIYSPSIKNYVPLFRAVFLEKGHHVIEFKYNKVFYWF